MNYALLLEEVKNNITKLYSSGGCPKLVYHNLSHTEDVVANTVKISNFYKLSDEDFFVVTAAAWFHDIGYCKGNVQGHELAGADMADEFLKDKGLDGSILTGIRQCILSTVLPQNPSVLLEQIICDADLFHLGTGDFAERNKLMRKETEERTGKKIDKEEWRKGTIKFMEAHHYQTEYCKNLLQGTKEKNLEKLKQKEAEAEAEQAPGTSETATATTVSAATPELKKNKKEKDDRPDKGIETMFRITSANHQRLSDMADNKAHIMITTTSIIISVLLSVLFRKLEENPYLTIPAILLLTVCVVTMVFAILATRPTLPPGKFTPDDIKNKKVNLLFFGNFYKMSLEEYSAGMQQMMIDREFLYGSLIRDVYSQGIVLGRKYRLLRIGYSIFMFGIVLAVITFVIASIFFSH